jgi:cob(I)alamin adenosyltransferase
MDERLEGALTEVLAKIVGARHTNDAAIMTEVLHEIQRDLMELLDMEFDNDSDSGELPY